MEQALAQAQPMDDACLRQILAEHRLELGGVLELWAARQELAVARALSTCTQAEALVLSNAGPSGDATNAFTDGEPGKVVKFEEQSSPGCAGFLDVSPDAQHLAFDVLANHATANGTCLDIGKPTDDLQAGNASMRSPAPASPANVMRSTWWRRQAKRADHDVEVAVDSWCPRLDMLGRIVNHVVFEFIVSTALLLNVAIIGFSTNHKVLMASSQEADDTMQILPWNKIEDVFIVIYCCELALRLFAFRVKFFTDEDRSWNIFDLFLVGTSVPELVAGSNNLSYFRTWRVLKLMKILRVVRLARGFHELRLVLSSILGSMKALMWSMIVVAGTTYMVSIAFVQSTTDFIYSADWKAVDGGHTPLRFVDLDGVTHELPAHGYFGSIMLGMQTLFASVTGGMDWIPLSEALLEVGGLYLFFFYAYICFFNFVIMNTMTSLFLDGVMHHSENDHSSIVREMLKKKVKFMADLRDLHRHMCDSGATEATLEGFLRHMNDPEMLNFARALEVDLVDLQVVFDVLSSGGQQSVDLESFVVGCIRLRGHAKSVDLISLSIAQKKLGISCEQHFASDNLRRGLPAVSLDPSPCRLSLSARSASRNSQGSSSWASI